MFDIVQLAKAAYASGKCVPQRKTYIRPMDDGKLGCCGLSAACIQKVGLEVVKNLDGMVWFPSFVDTTLDTATEYRIGFTAGFDCIAVQNFDKAVKSQWQQGYQDGYKLAKEVFDGTV